MCPLSFGPALLLVQLPARGNHWKKIPPPAHFIKTITIVLARLPLCGTSNFWGGLRGVRSL